MDSSIFLIGIAGPSGSGKSHLAAELHQRMKRLGRQKELSILNEDAYYRDTGEMSQGQRSKINFDHPDALEHDLLVKHLEDLKTGKGISVPRYDYSTHRRKKETETFQPTPIVLLEGILIFHDRQISDRLDLKIFLDVPLEVCLARRLKRDTSQRGRTADSVLRQFEQTVRPMYFQFIEPSRKQANLVLPMDRENQVAVDFLFHALCGLVPKNDGNTQP
ncbi:MAG: uridine kinase [Planctomycetota bacterium]|nr:uridine kinase [Planctomycetota bacterium]